METAHLLRSTKNARRLLQALARAQVGTEKPQTLEAVKKETGLEDQAVLKSCLRKLDSILKLYIISYIYFQ
jgi:antitoxin YefM